MVEAKLEVLVTNQGKDRGGPGTVVDLRMTDEQWAELLRRSETCTPMQLVDYALAHRIGYEA